MSGWPLLLLLCLQRAAATKLSGPSGNDQAPVMRRSPSSRLDLRHAPWSGAADLSRVPVWDCSDMPYGTASGVFSILEGAGGPPVWAYCDFSDPAGWTVLQRRQDTATQLGFDRPYDDYRYGFGELDAEFWWGLEYMWRVTARHDRVYELMIELADFDGNSRHALYGEFSISSHEGKFQLFASNYSGDAGDSLSYHSGMKFSAMDQDNDISTAHCGDIYQAGWWFRSCHQCNLNGIYFGNNNPTVAQNGVVWSTWRGFYYSLKDVVMKIRPRRKLT